MNAQRRFLPINERFKQEKVYNNIEGDIYVEIKGRNKRVYEGLEKS